MIHSASFLATGSDIAASVWVASPGLWARTSSMTFSSASVSACDVDAVAATAACGGGLRAGGGGSAACWRVAGAIAAGAGAAFFVAALAGFLELGEVFGTTLRAIGRGFGNGTFGLAQASAAMADNPSASARLVAKAVDRNAVARVDGVTAFLRGESFNRSRPRSI